MKLDDSDADAAKASVLTEEEQAQGKIYEEPNLIFFFLTILLHSTVLEDESQSVTLCTVLSIFFLSLSFGGKRKNYNTFPQL